MKSNQPKQSIPRAMKRDQATELYKQLQQKMAAPSSSKRAAPQARVNYSKLRKSFKIPRFNGNSAAIGFVLLFACAKIGISAAEHMGFLQVEKAQATLVANPPITYVTPISQPKSDKPLSREEIKVLTLLDQRRVEIENRANDVEKRTEALSEKERELTVRLNEVRVLTERLKVERERGDMRRSAQIEQLAKVYGTMAPEEAAQLMNQLDVTIALDLLQRMPDKRIGQILALLSPERALTITQMLTQR